MPGDQEGTALTFSCAAVTASSVGQACSLCPTPFNTHQPTFLTPRPNPTEHITASLQRSERFHAVLQHSRLENSCSPSPPKPLLPQRLRAAGWKCPSNSTENPHSSKSVRNAELSPAFPSFPRAGRPAGRPSRRTDALHTPLGRNTSSAASRKRGQRFFCVLFPTRAKHAPGQFPWLSGTLMLFSVPGSHHRASLAPAQATCKLLEHCRGRRLGTASSQKASHTGRNQGMLPQQISFGAPGGQVSCSSTPCQSQKEGPSDRLHHLHHPKPLLLGKLPHYHLINYVDEY